MLEVAEELAKETGAHVDRAGFQVALEDHQRRSREGSQRRFAGGLGTAMGGQHNQAVHPADWGVGSAHAEPGIRRRHLVQVYLHCHSGLEFAFQILWHSP